jgi:hypothetical protein
MDGFSLIILRAGLRQCRDKLKMSNVMLGTDFKIPVVGAVKGEDGLYRPVD